MSLERVFSLNLLCSYLDPSCQVNEQQALFKEVHQLLSSCSKQLEPELTRRLVLEESKDGSNAKEAKGFVDCTFRRLRQTSVLNRVIDSYLVDFEKVPTANGRAGSMTAKWTNLEASMLHKRTYMPLVEKPTAAQEQKE